MCRPHNHPGFSLSSAAAQNHRRIVALERGIGTGANLSPRTSSSFLLPILPTLEEMKRNGIGEWVEQTIDTIFRVYRQVSPLEMAQYGNILFQYHTKERERGSLQKPMSSLAVATPHLRSLPAPIRAKVTPPSLSRLSVCRKGMCAIFKSSIRQF